MPYQYDRDDIVFLAQATDFATIRNSAGAASLANGDACKHRSLSAEPGHPRLQAPDKESTATLGYKDSSIRGRSPALPSTIVTPLFSASAAGVEPDNGILFESGYGKKTITADTSVLYGPNGSKYMNETAPIAVEFWRLNTAVSKRGVAGVGIVNRLVIQATQDYAELTAELLSYNNLTQDRFAAAITAEKMGLAAWPSVPSSPSYTGSPLTGFTGSLTLDGTTYTCVRSVRCEDNFARAFRGDKFALDGSEYLPSEPYELQPEFLLDFSLYAKSTDSNLDALIAKMAARTPFDGTLVLGNTVGGTYTKSFNNLLFPDGREPMLEVGDDRKSITARGLRAQITTVGGSRDESSVTLT